MRCLLPRVWMELLLPTYSHKSVLKYFKPEFILGGYHIYFWGNVDDLIPRSIEHHDGSISSLNIKNDITEYGFVFGLRFSFFKKIYLQWDSLIRDVYNWEAKIGYIFLLKNKINV